MKDYIVVPKASGQLPGSFKVIVRVRSENTNGIMSVIEETLAPKAFVSPHVHSNDVWVYVLSGEIGVLVGEKVVKAREGDWALKPRNIQHAMWNPSSMPARVIEVITPGGTEKWFEEISTLSKADKDGFKEACVRHGIEFLPNSHWINDLRKQFQLN